MSRVLGPREQDAMVGVDDERPLAARATLDMPAAKPPRVVIESVSPSVDGGRFAAKRTVGDLVQVEADIFTEGHDTIAASLLWRHQSDARWHELPMTLLNNDRFRGQFVVDCLGSYRFTISAWIDEFATWLSALRLRVAAAQDVGVDLLEGQQLLERALERARAQDRRQIERFSADIAAGRLAVIDDPALVSVMRRADGRRSLNQLPRPLPVIVERSRARFSSWYELFPRSTSTNPAHPGTFEDVIARLPYVASMGFDVLYLPPVHPIGRAHRKGRNNVTVPQRGDVGSPWAIGAAEGGHEAVHPELGTIDDFRRLVNAAQHHGMEIALDLALQCSPDHPWVHDHPTWFRRRPDGTIRTAENPPKRYEDIFPLDFESEDWQDLWLAIADLVETWIGRGVKIFRVDNPHTKPFAFWEWLLANTRQSHPDVIFLSEAFTRPKVMHQLAKLGFSQSYTYFTWRQSARELHDYFTELRSGEVPEYFRPNAWPNTPDILTEQLQEGTRGTFITRFVLASTLCANYGIYGPVFELGLRQPRAGSEEYVDSEKYEVRWWNLDRPDSLHDIIATVNDARRTHRALQSDDNLHFHPTDNAQLLCFSKTVGGAMDSLDDEWSAPIVVVVNTDRRHTQAGFVELDLDELGLGPHQPFIAHDLLGGGRYTWQGSRNFVELDALRQPAHIFEIRPQHAAAPNGHSTTAESR